MSHGFGKADFLEYSYPIDLPPSVLPPVRRFLLAHEHPYSCFDTFDHSLNQDVRTLDLQIRAYLQEVGHKNTDVYLIGDSLGGAIGFGYLSLLKTKGWSALPNGGQLKGVITLDAPLGGVPNADLGAIQAVFDTKCGRGPARSIDPLDELETVFFDNTGEAKPLGGTADLTHVIFPKFSVPTGFDNQQLADEAASHNIHVLTIGNDRDFGYAIANCDILNFTSLVDYVTSQFVHNEPPLSGVYGREISVSVRNNQQCTLDLLHFEINHGAVLTDSTVQKGIVDFIENNNPDPLLSPAELLA